MRKFTLIRIPQSETTNGLVIEQEYDERKNFSVLSGGMLVDAETIVGGMVGYWDHDSGKWEMPIMDDGGIGETVQGFADHESEIYLALWEVVENWGKRNEAW